MRTVVFGAGGFIGSHLAKRIHKDGFAVTGVDQKKPEFSKTACDVFFLGDLRDVSFVRKVFERELTQLKSGEDLRIFQLAADMGGAGFVFTGENDAEIMHNSSLINLNILKVASELVDSKLINSSQIRIFYASSACVYPEELQINSELVDLREELAYPANPDSDYGWEKLFSERLFAAFARNKGIQVRIARYHNVYGPEGAWRGGREKAPAAICRKVAEIVGESGEIEVWGSGEQTRSFLYIDDCVEATLRLMESAHDSPINIGSEEMVTINYLVRAAADLAGKVVTIRHRLDGPIGVQGRNSNNDMIREALSWDYTVELSQGLSHTYEWIRDQLSFSD